MIGISELGLYNITIDFGKMETYVTNNNIIYKENDFHTARVRAKLVKNDIPVNLTNVKVEFKIMTSSMATMQHDATILDVEKGIIEYKFPDNALYEGINHFEVILTEDEMMKVSPRMSYKVLDVINDSGIVAEANYPILVQLISDVKELQKQEEIIQKNEEKRVEEFNQIKSEFEVLKIQNDTNIKELKDARNDVDGVAHPQLKDRLDKIEYQLHSHYETVEG